MPEFTPITWAQTNKSLYCDNQGTDIDFRGIAQNTQIQFSKVHFRDELYQKSTPSVQRPPCKPFGHGGRQIKINILKFRCNYSDAFSFNTKNVLEIRYQQVVYLKRSGYN